MSTRHLVEEAQRVRRSPDGPAAARLLFGESPPTHPPTVAALLRATALELELAVLHLRRVALDHEHEHVLKAGD